jgi:hypothetical protein
MELVTVIICFIAFVPSVVLIVAQLQLFAIGPLPEELVTGAKAGNKQTIEPAALTEQPKSRSIATAPVATEEVYKQNWTSVIASSRAGKSIIRKPQLVFLGTTTLYGTEPIRSHSYSPRSVRR